jgi:hypothetical protein
MTFTEQDKLQIQKKGLTINEVEKQLELFKTGLPFINLKSAATVKNGILRLTEEKQKEYISLFDDNNSLSVSKFVPASGAATRMFKFLFEFLETYNANKESINSYINRHKALNLSLFFVGLEQFPFFEEVLNKVMQDIPNFNDLKRDERKIVFIKTILEKDKLNYGAYPKGLLPFHKCEYRISTAFQEHLHESVLYINKQGRSKIHFTISKQHRELFNQELEKIKSEIEEKSKTTFNISFSYQKEATDTIAVTPDNVPLRDNNNQLIFRPSGHGALLENLNTIDDDIIFIKNIDNVVPDRFINDVANYKKILAGILIEKQSQVFNYLHRLDKEDISEEEIITIGEFLHYDLQITISVEFEKYAKKYQISYLKNKLNRPIRICGMVKNESEPGGGPFWVKSENGSISLQIIESAQVDMKNKSQKKIFKSATHFNPVDIVCCIKDYKGNRFDLNDFTDPKTAFITSKTKDGKELKALERPGLWNGSMANWTTLFVEVPLYTFNPAKTVNDLLKDSHQVF